MIDHVGNGINIIDRLMAATGHWPSEKQLIDAVAAFGRAVEREVWARVYNEGHKYGFDSHVARPQKDLEVEFMQWVREQGA